MGPRTVKWIVFLFLFAFAFQANAASKKLYPVDEASNDPSFKAFRDKLLTAAQQKDLKFLKRIIDPEIEWSFGAGPGARSFIKFWNLNDLKSSFWGELTNLLLLGGTFNDTSGTCFTAPYIFSQFPDAYDPYDFGVIIGNAVTMHRSPDLNSPKTAELSYDIVKDLTYKECDCHEKCECYEDCNGVGEYAHQWCYTWKHIQTLDQKRGYVLTKFFRRAIDNRAIFCKEGARWVMKYFIGGD